MVSPSPWHPTLPGVGAFTNWTAAQFSAAYAAENAGEVPAYQGASFFGGMAALGAAIEAAGTLETDAVAAQLRSLDMFDVFGRTRFDANGQGTVAMIPLQHIPGSGAQAMVSEASLVVHSVCDVWGICAEDPAGLRRNKSPPGSFLLDFACALWGTPQSRVFQRHGSMVPRCTVKWCRGSTTSMNSTMHNVHDRLRDRTEARTVGRRRVGRLRSVEF